MPTGNLKTDILKVPALVSCDKSNAASAGVIRNCGGVLKHEINSENYNETLQMYVIKR